MKMEHEIMKTFLKNKNIIYIFVGLFLIMLFLFFRLFYVRLPRNLYTNITFELLAMYLVITIIIIISLGFTVYKLLIEYEYIKSNNNSIVNRYIQNNSLIKLVKTCINLCKHSLITLDNYIKFYIITKWLFIGLFFMNKITKHIKYENAPYLTLIFDFIPRILITILFSIDVFIYHKFDFFYKAMPMLLLPVIYQYICYTLKNICELNLQSAEDIFLIIDTTNNIKLSPIEYVKSYIRKAWDNPKLINSSFSEYSLLNNNLEAYTFGWTQNYIDKNQTKFNKMTNDEITQAFFVSYLQFNQLFVLTSIYLFNIELTKDKQLTWIRLSLSSILLLNWTYIIYYGF